MLSFSALPFTASNISAFPFHCIPLHSCPPLLHSASDEYELYHRAGDMSLLTSPMPVPLATEVPLDNTLLADAAQRSKARFVSDCASYLQVCWIQQEMIELWAITKKGVQRFHEGFRVDKECQGVDKG